MIRTGWQDALAGSRDLPRGRLACNLRLKPAALKKAADRSDWITDITSDRQPGRGTKQ